MRFLLCRVHDLPCGVRAALNGGLDCQSIFVGSPLGDLVESFHDVGPESGHELNPSSQIADSTEVVDVEGVEGVGMLEMSEVKILETPDEPKHLDELEHGLGEEGGKRASA